MAQKLVSMTVFLAGLIAAILVSSVVSVVVSTQWAATRYVIEGSFDVTQDGDVIEERTDTN